MWNFILLIMIKFQKDSEIRPYVSMDEYRYSRRFCTQVGDDELNSTNCVPFMSEYSDCSESNYCSGCNRCTCDEEGKWDCKTIFSCPVDEDDPDPSDEDAVATSFDVLYNELKNREKKKTRPYVPQPPNPKDDLIVPENRPYEDFQTYLSRQKRSLKESTRDKKKANHTVKFFHTTDELNEDTLKDSNKTGTIEVARVDTSGIPKVSRRTGILDNFNKSTLSSLHIEYGQPQDYDPHISENKIDATLRNKVDDNDFRNLLGNFSQSDKDKDISRLVVNELKAGSEIIGNNNVAPVSNITFTPENDTLTAMAFIAGNLLSKLWDMEKAPTDDSIETEVLKHEKINDLLDLFKEPLSIRQETFLKNALEKLSDTLNKNKAIKNVSICETISEFDLLKNDQEKLNVHSLGDKNFTKTKCKEKIKPIPFENEKKYNISTDALLKINNVLNLIKKFEKIQSTISDLNHDNNPDFSHKEILDIDEHSSLQIFGSLLDKITKLLIPSRDINKKITSQLKNMHQFRNDNNINKILKQKFNIDLSNINITTKDKLVLDYLNHIERNPNCSFGKSIENPKTNFEGSILYNLSEFFKIKSFVDLIKLTNSDTSNKEKDKLRTEKPYETTTVKYFLRNNFTHEIKHINSTKEKLKFHLKAIIDDLLELQTEESVGNRNNINIVEALPCIYNILNVDKILADHNVKKNDTFVQIAPLDNMKNIIDTIKTELTTRLPTRRNNAVIIQEKPKSVEIWERIIKNINEQRKKTRRSFNTQKSKTFDELKNIIGQTELIGNSYKNFALLSVISPQKRLMLLKTLEADNKQHSSALENLNNSMEIINNLPSNKRHDIEEFVNNAINNVRLSIRVLENLDKSKQNVNLVAELVAPTRNKVVNRQSLKMPKAFGFNHENKRNIKLSRDQILNQLMMNRVQLYLNSKETDGSRLNDNINYNIGKRILVHIQSGNLNIAKELFKVFLANKQKEDMKKNSVVQDKSVTVSHERKKGPLLLALQEPLIRFDGPQKSPETKTDDYIFRQLLKLKDMQ